MSRSVSLRYLAQKLLVAANEAASAVQGSAATSVSDALARGLKAFNCQLTAVGIVTGAAMAPTLNAAVSSSPHATERFLMRRIPHATPHKTVFEGDVIAFTSPLAVPGVDGSGNHVLVRRVAALEGDELIAGDENDPEESRVVPKDHCWVLADNDALSPQDASDSRTFGPLALQHVLGRVLYAAASESNHGPIENSPQSMAIDAPVLEAELDLEVLCENAGDEDTDSVNATKDSSTTRNRGR